MKIGQEIMFTTPNGFKGVGTIAKMDGLQVVAVKIFTSTGSVRIIDTANFIVDLITIVSGVMPMLKGLWRDLFGTRAERLQRRELRRQRRAIKNQIKSQL